MITANLKITALSVALLASSFTNAAEKVSQGLDVTAGGKVRISIERGKVEVRGWDKDQVFIEGQLDDATKEFIFADNNGETVIEVEIEDGYWDKGWNSDATDLLIHVPQQSFLVASGVSTEFDVNDVIGAELNTVSGDLRIEKAFEAINAKTISGDIRIDDSKAKVKAASVSGDIDINSESIFFDAQTVSGDIDAKIGQSELVELTSVSGDVDLKFELIKGGRIDAETVSGDMNFKFENSTVDARFEINTGPGGDIRNKLTDDEPESSFIGAEKIRFKSGRGSASVEISTMSGTVSLEN